MKQSVINCETVGLPDLQLFLVSLPLIYIIVFFFFFCLYSFPFLSFYIGSFHFFPLGCSFLFFSACVSLYSLIPCFSFCSLFVSNISFPWFGLVNNESIIIKLIYIAQFDINSIPTALFLPVFLFLFHSFSVPICYYRSHFLLYVVNPSHFWFFFHRLVGLVVKASASGAGFFRVESYQ